MTKVFVAAFLGLGLLVAGCTGDFAENCFARARAGGEGNGIPGSETVPGQGAGAGGADAESGCSKTPVDN
jgi:hypothetical protein